VPGSNRDFDVFAWGAIAYLEADLGVVKPFIGAVYGTGDNDPNDTDLTGFHHLPNAQNSSAITGTPRFSHLDRAVAFGSRDIHTPALAAGANGVFGGGGQFGHSVGNPYNDRLGNRAHPGLNTTLSNPGVIEPFVGVQVFPVQSHEVDLVYLYRAMATSATIDAALGVPISNTLYHEVNAQWQWTLSRHFDIRLAGSVLFPADGAKDIARTSTTFPCTTANPCTGDDPLLYGEARFRARF
jgi:hypothetical protein